MDEVVGTKEVGTIKDAVVLKASTTCAGSIMFAVLMVVVFLIS